MTPYLSRISGTSVIPNSATAVSESCSGIRHRLMSRCERSLVGREASIGCEFQNALSSEEQSFQYRTEGQGRKIAESHHRYQAGREQGAEHKGMGRKSSRGRRRVSLTTKQFCECQCGNRQAEPTHHHRQRCGEVVKRSVRTQTGKALAVIGEAGSIGKKNLSEPMPATVDRQPGKSQPGAHGNRGEWKDDQWRSQGVQHDHFVLRGPYLLPKVFRRPPNHKSREKHSDRGGHNHAVKTTPQTSEYELSQQHVYKQHHAAERCVAVVH